MESLKEQNPFCDAAIEESTVMSQHQKNRKL
jgi:hypothetical protein